MGVKRFLFFTAAGVTLWNLMLVEGGRRLAIWLAQSQDVIGWIIIGFVAVAVLGYLWRVFTWKPRSER